MGWVSRPKPREFSPMDVRRTMGCFFLVPFRSVNSVQIPLNEYILILASAYPEKFSVGTVRRLVSYALSKNHMTLTDGILTLNSDDLWESEVPLGWTPAPEKLLNERLDKVTSGKTIPPCELVDFFSSVTNIEGDKTEEFLSELLEMDKKLRHEYLEGGFSQNIDSDIQPKNVFPAAESATDEVLTKSEGETARNDTLTKRQRAICVGIKN